MSSSENVFGSISKPFYISAEFEWSMNAFSAEILDTNGYLESPTFSFSDCSWCVRMYPKGVGSCAVGWMSLFLVKKKSQSEKNISFSVLTTFHDVLLAHYTATYTFKKGVDDWGWPLYIPRHKFLKCCWVKETRDYSQLFIKITLNQNATSKKDTLLEVKMQDKILHQNYKDLLLHDTEHDLIIKVKDKEFKVHQIIMRFRCPVFKLMLAHDMLERNSGLVEIPDCDPLAFEQFLLYVYTGNIEALDESVMLNLYYIADKYDMAYLKEMCSEFIKKSLSARNVCDVIRLALNHGDSSLLECGHIYFADNSEQVLLTTEWRSFMNENPDQANELLLKTISYYKPKKRKRSES